MHHAHLRPHNRLHRHQHLPLQNPFSPSNKLKGVSGSHVGMCLLPANHVTIVCKSISLLASQMSILPLALQAQPFLGSHLILRPSRLTKVLLQLRSSTRKVLPVITTISGVKVAIPLIPDTWCNQHRALKITHVHVGGYYVCAPPDAFAGR